NKNPNGMGCNVFITTPQLFNELAAQADARGIMVHNGGLPNHSLTGIRFQLIEHDSVYYTWDAKCPSGTMYCLDLDTFLMEMAEGGNFEFSGFRDKELEEGGAKYEHGSYNAMFRFSCRAPYLNGVVTGLTTT
ncbi:MAG: hypothetical protein Q8R92_01810, partial [Deltaproteobacteria bacterium]|nr:hypothetical protein [Deltaproteobacteria bacterium]